MFFASNVDLFPKLSCYSGFCVTQGPYVSGGLKATKFSKSEAGHHDAMFSSVQHQGMLLGVRLVSKACCMAVAS